LRKIYSEIIFVNKIFYYFYNKKCRNIWFYIYYQYCNLIAIKNRYLLYFIQKKIFIISNIILSIYTIILKSQKIIDRNLSVKSNTDIINIYLYYLNLEIYLQYFNILFLIY